MLGNNVDKNSVILSPSVLSYAKWNQDQRWARQL